MGGQIRSVENIHSHWENILLLGRSLLVTETIFAWFEILTYTEENLPEYTQTQHGKYASMNHWDDGRCLKNYRENIYIYIMNYVYYTCERTIYYACITDKIFIFLSPTKTPVAAAMSLHWRHNGYDSVSNHQPHDCLLNRLFRRRSKKTSKLRVTGLCAGNSQ